MFDIIKALHVTGVIVWMSAMLAAPALLHLSTGDAAKRGARLFFRLISGVGITLTWVLGLWLVSVSGYISEPWMIAKLVIVLVLSGAQGAFAARFRRACQDLPADRTALSARSVTGLILGQTALVAAIALLVLTKPF
ncbi:MAG: CopD family protein [Pseudomonadota bacterium]